MIQRNTDNFTEFIIQDKEKIYFMFKIKSFILFQKVLVFLQV